MDLSLHGMYYPFALGFVFIGTSIIKPRKISHKTVEYAKVCLWVTLQTTICTFPALSFQLASIRVFSIFLQPWTLVVNQESLPIFSKITEDNSLETITQDLLDLAPPLLPTEQIGPKIWVRNIFFSSSRKDTT